jgi:hypothetical protein
MFNEKTFNVSDPNNIGHLNFIQQARREWDERFDKMNKRMDIQAALSERRLSKLATFGKHLPISLLRKDSSNLPILEKELSSLVDGKTNE